MAGLRGLAVGIGSGLIAAALGTPPASVAPGPRDGSAPDVGGADASVPPTAFSVVVLPDTQYYSSSWPDIFAAQTRWIIKNRESEQIAFVLHTGDVVDSDLPA